MKRVRILIALKDVPDGERITKRGGEKPYIVRRQINVYQPNTKSAPIVPPPGCRLLVAENGDINIMDEGVEVAWDVAIPTLIAHLQMLEALPEEDK